jgi:anti-anti-sigma factor
LAVIEPAPSAFWDSNAVQFGLDVIICTSCVEVRVRGELDVVSAPSMERQLIDALEETQPARLIVDMRDLTFLDSTGINVLVRTHQLLAAAGGQLLLQSPSDFACHVLTIAGLAEIFVPPDGQSGGDATQS